jgi:hypothetical protein
MKTEIINLVKQAQEESDALREKISELHLRIQAGLPPEQLDLVEAQIRQLEIALGSKITSDTERMRMGRQASGPAAQA